MATGLRRPFFILLCFVLEDFLSTLRIISGSSGFVKFSICSHQLFLSLLKIFLKTLNSSVKSIHLSLSSKKRLLFILQLKADNHKPFICLIKLSLKLSSLRYKLSNLILGLVCSDLCHLASLLTDITSVTGIILLHLHSLHLLLDGIHLLSKETSVIPYCC